jgi:hypothetical protein
MIAAVYMDADLEQQGPRQQMLNAPELSLAQFRCAMRATRGFDRNA